LAGNDSGYILPGMEIQIEDNPSVEPLCPHCEKEVRVLYLRQIESMLGVRYLYYCSECRKALGISHRKGFWMG